MHGQQCQVRGQRSKNGFYNKKKIRMACIIKQLLDSVFVISGIIKVSVSVISLSLRLRLITLTSTLIIPDITKTSSNNCLLADFFFKIYVNWKVNPRRFDHDFRFTILGSP